jgi:hypothetical protein
MRLVVSALALAVALGFAWQLIPPSAPPVVASVAPPADVLSDCVPGYCPLPIPLFP